MFEWIFFILAGNEDNHKSWDEFEFRPDPITDYRVSTFMFYAILHVILGSNKDKHKSLDEFVFQLDLTLNYGVQPDLTMDS